MVSSLAAPGAWRRIKGLGGKGSVFRHLVVAHHVAIGREAKAEILAELRERAAEPLPDRLDRSR
jgi:hypothetical protein